MATDGPARRPRDILAAHAPDTYAAFRALRDTTQGGPLPPYVRELIICTGFMLAGHQRGYQTHARRALDVGATVGQLRQAIVATLASTATYSQVVDTLAWMEAIVRDGDAE